MRRHLRKMLFGVSFLFFFSLEDCVDIYCFNHDFEPPICDFEVA
ncbi:MAG: hypothetical protein ACREK2_06110 [Gemmatimonadota bacterium]